MKKTKKLALRKETLRALDGRSLAGAAGGTSAWTVVVGNCPPAHKTEPQPNPYLTYKCTLYPCFTDELTIHCPA